MTTIILATKSMGESESDRGRTRSETANTPGVLAQLLPELLRHGPGQQGLFGHGLAMETHDLVGLWQQFRSVLATLPDRERNVSLMRGLIDAATKRDPDAASRLWTRP